MDKGWTGWTIVFKGPQNWKTSDIEWMELHKLVKRDSVSTMDIVKLKTVGKERYQNVCYTIKIVKNGKNHQASDYASAFKKKIQTDGVDSSCIIEDNMDNFIRLGFKYLEDVMKFIEQWKIILDQDDGIEV